MHRVTCLVISHNFPSGHEQPRGDNSQQQHCLHRINGVILVFSILIRRERGNEHITGESKFPYVRTKRVNRFAPLFLHSFFLSYTTNRKPSLLRFFCSFASDVSSIGAISVQFEVHASRQLSSSAPFLFHNASSSSFYSSLRESRWLLARSPLPRPASIFAAPFSINRPPKTACAYFSAEYCPLCGRRLVDSVRYFSTHFSRRRQLECATHALITAKLNNDMCNALSATQKYSASTCSVLE